MPNVTVAPPAARVAQYVVIIIGALLAVPGILVGILMLWMTVSTPTNDRTFAILFTSAIWFFLAIPGVVYLMFSRELSKPHRRLPRTITTTAAIGVAGGLLLQGWLGELIGPGLPLIAAHGAVLLSVILATRAWQQAHKSGYASPTGHGFQPIIYIPPEACRHYPPPPPPAKYARTRSLD